MEHPRVLVTEDDFIVGLDLCDTMAEMGCVVEGPFPDVSSAMLAVQKIRPDVAILDVNLTDGQAYGLAESLIAENVPVILHSGLLTEPEIQARVPGATACVKPCPPSEMMAMVNAALTH